MEYTDGLTLRDLRHLIDQTAEWEKDIAKAKVKMEESKLRCLFSNLSKMFRFR